MDSLQEDIARLNRRNFLRRMGNGLGAAAASTLLNPGLIGTARATEGTAGGGLGLAGFPNHTPTAKNIIYLFFSGGPSHIDLFDYKPALRKIHGMELPDSVRGGQRITGMTSGQKEFPCVAPMFDFQKYGQSGIYVSELLPHTASVIDEISLIKTVNTEAINHDPAITFISTGTQQPGRPCLGSWLSYGLGSENQNMPAYVVMISKGRGQSQALYARLWGSGFLPSRYQGVNFRSSGDPVLYLSNPPGMDRGNRRKVLDVLNQFNQDKIGRAHV